MEKKSKMTKYKLSDFKTPEKHMHLLWRRFVIDPIFKFPCYLIANYTKITPNQINLLTLILSILQFYFFSKGSFIIGAVFNQLSFGFDQIDGKLARLRNIVTKQGTLTDGLCDKLRVFLGVLGLIIYFKQDLILIILLTAFLFTNLMFDFIGLFLLYRVPHVFDKKLVLKDSEIISKQSKLSYSTQEQEALVFLFAPVLYFFYPKSIYYIISLAVILMILYLSLRVFKAIRRYNKKQQILKG